MTRAELVNIAELHGVQHKTEPGGAVYFLEVYTVTDGDGVPRPGAEWVNVTEWSRRRVFLWLGY